MKIKSSTQWSSIYSTELKYNIKIKASQLKLAVYGCVVTLLVLASIVTFTFNYVLAQSIAALCIIVFSVYFSSKNEQPVHSSLILTHTGEIQLISPHSSLDNSDLPLTIYQLEATSRINFMGCWLIMTPNLSELTPESELLVRHQSYQKSGGSNFRPKQLFIFRDSITKQDFSRIANVINQL